ncbi:hypothetical protein L6452_27172 [Arctium lappa]|uniref:Uncharacterized protein n=1 Tax=Arctium lappa TaxID=4217 RepID=A0ACB9A0A0_ARCLA|nr:hypothetical protein L6452_27172 [Arctium lappa]
MCGFLQKTTAQQPRLEPPRSLQEALQSKLNLDTTQQRSLEPPWSPVRTDLVLGPKKASKTIVPKDNKDLTVKDLLGCISFEPKAKIQGFHKGKFANAANTDSFKKLLKGLMKKAWWQPEAASTITQCKVDSGSRGSVWLLFVGPDKMAKKKIAIVIAPKVLL